ncbi:FAD-dependent monooxygenase [Janthinobacterium sp.]|uniref:FAD-dependent monooxygenase n=1 Tax=Janthinobacterium sp. TaxID=1871054 RepID=UPI0025B8C0EA|nr:FAD-dependent monooxygenase [Janthinobacterium sp.]NBV15578.1 FAD-binding monooxygenase [Janthinobacterium sp.]
MKKQRSILVTGASVAGPTLAYWLARQGMAVTVVERAPEFRDGGQTIDVRGAGKVVAQRMGLESAIRARSTHEDGIRFVDEQDRTRAEIGIGAFDGNGPVAELEILRGELARLLIEHGRSTVEYRFGDSIAALEDLPHGVKVRFAQGGEEMFDLVIAAEGVGSPTRKLVFGDEVRRRSFKLYTAYFTIPRAPGDARQMRWFNAPGGLSVCVRPDNLGTSRALLSFQEAANGYEKLSPARQKTLLKEKFAGLKWETPRILAALDDAPDLYLDQISQVKMARWSKGRIALVGDAAYCASPISGMGTSLGMCGAYVLAGELGRHDDHAQAFAAYESIMRPYVDQAQDVPLFAPRLASPHSRAGIALGHALLRMSNVPIVKSLLARFLTPKADALALPDYAHMR